MKKRVFYFLVFVLAVLVLSGCAVATCPPYLLAAPSLSSPAQWAVVSSLTPSLTWTWPIIHYPLPTSSGTCIPEKYQVDLQTGPFFVDNLGGERAGNVNSFTPVSDLAPGKTYRWGVLPRSFGENGLYAGYRYFFTGDLCDTAALSAPELLSPYDGAEVSDLEPTLIWQYLDECRPEGYRIDLSTDVTFADTSLSGGTGNSDTRWGAGVPLMDCTRYYWKVAPINGTTLGPASPAFTFRTNTGACAPVPEAGSAFIGGKVWQDLCAIPDGPVPVVMPAGCVATAGGGMSADGVYTPGEPGIKNVMVRLGAGSCPATGSGVMLTDESGYYQFTNLPAGHYCVTINVDENIGQLIPGGWTKPGDAGNTAQWDVIVADGEWKDHTNFGWMYQFGATMEYAYVKGKVWSDLCSQTLKTVSGTPAAGCVKDYWGEVRADGVYDPATESGIPGVQVLLYKTPCGTSSPEQVYALTYTNENGIYDFMAAIPGEWGDFCVKIKADSAINTPILIPGLWSYDKLPAANMTNWENFQVWGGESFNFDFGWDYLDLLQIGEIDWPVFEVFDPIYCYIGPDYKMYRAYRRLSPGWMFRILGTDPTRMWFLINVEELLGSDGMTGATPTPVPGGGVECWVPGSGGKASGDLGRLGIFTGPRIITPTPTPVLPVEVKHCIDYTTRIRCNNHANEGCKWIQLSDTKGYCSGP